MKRVLLGSVFALALLVLPMAVPAASAHDSYPCGPVRNGHQVCQMWRGNVPVLNTNWHVVGHLWNASGNWFVCQQRGGTYHVPGTSYYNNWWAYTLSDDGGWGWVSEAYFKGGNNYERDAGLRSC